MKIVECDGSMREAWDTFVRASPLASFYHRYDWADINADLFGHRTFALAAVDQGTIVGVFPLVQVKSLLFGNILCSMPFVNYGGPCAADPAVEQLLVEEGTRICDRLRADYMEIRSWQPLAHDLPVSMHKVSLTLELTPDHDAVWNAFTSKHRQEVRRAYKNGLTARFGTTELIDPFYEVLSESWRNLGTPIYQKRYFERIVQTFAPHVRLCVVYAGDEPAGAAFDGLHNGTIEGMWLGYKAKFRNLLVGYVLYWELIKNACEIGYTHFHLGRSTVDSGSETFKKKWNAEAAQLYWNYFLRTRKEMPGLNVSNPRYQQAISLWRRLPLGVTQAIGPRIARSIP